MNAENLPNALKNQSLFSNHYLDARIVEQPQWADTPDIESDYAAIKELFDTVAPNAEHLNEAQTEQQFIQPLLKQLGHTFEVQPTLHTSQGPNAPITPSSHRRMPTTQRSRTSTPTRSSEPPSLSAMPRRGLAT